jgi:hypothetical protein
MLTLYQIVVPAQRFVKTEDVYLGFELTDRKAMGRQALDPAFRAASANGGRAQAGRVARAVAEVWS